MNICFLFGKINSDINFEFLLENKKYISIASCFVLSKYGTEVLLYAFDELADKLYSSYEKGFYIKIEGRVKKNYIEVTKIYEY